MSSTMAFTRGVDHERIQELIEGLETTVTHPEFIEGIRRLEEVPEEDERRRRAEEFARVEVFRERGIPTPDGFRVTTRVFERPEDGRRNVGDPVSPMRAPDDAMLGVCASVGWIVCVSYGE